MLVVTERADKQESRHFRWLTAALVTGLIPALAVAVLLLVAWMHPVELTLGERHFSCRWQPSYDDTDGPVAMVRRRSDGFTAVAGARGAYCSMELGSLWAGSYLWSTR
jgi:hypothetical protein